MAKVPRPFPGRVRPFGESGSARRTARPVPFACSAVRAPEPPASAAGKPIRRPASEFPAEPLRKRFGRDRRPRTGEVLILEEPRPGSGRFHCVFPEIGHFFVENSPSRLEKVPIPRETRRLNRMAFDGGEKRMLSEQRGHPRLALASSD